MMKRFRVKLQRVEFQEATVEIDAEEGSCKEDIEQEAIESAPDFQCVTANEECLSIEEINT